MTTRCPIRSLGQCSSCVVVKQGPEIIDWVSKTKEGGLEGMRRISSSLRRQLCPKHISFPEKVSKEVNGDE